MLNVQRQKALKCAGGDRIPVEKREASFGVLRIAYEKDRGVRSSIPEGPDGPMVKGDENREKVTTDVASGTNASRVQSFGQGILLCLENEAYDSQNAKKRDHIGFKHRTGPTE